MPKRSRQPKAKKQKVTFALTPQEEEAYAKVFSAAQPCATQRETGKRGKWVRAYNECIFLEQPNAMPETNAPPSGRTQQQELLEYYDKELQDPTKISIWERIKQKRDLLWEKMFGPNHVTGGGIGQSFVPFVAKR